MKKIYLKTLLTFVLSLLFGVQGWAADVTVDAKDGDITQYNGQTVNITIKNRTYQAKNWVVVCYPFNVTKDMLDEAFPQGYAVEEYSSMSADGKFTFTVLDLSTNNIPAGTPFLLKSKVEVSSVTFNNVTINTTLHNVTKTNGSFSGTLNGTYDKLDLWKFNSGQDHAGYLFISASQTLVGPYSGPLNSDNEKLLITNGYFSFSTGVSPTLNIEYVTIGGGDNTDDNTDEGGDTGGNSGSGIKMGVKTEITGAWDNTARQIPASAFLSEAQSAILQFVGTNYCLFTNTNTDTTVREFQWNDANQLGVTLVLTGDLLQAAKNGYLSIKVNGGSSYKFYVTNFPTETPIREQLTDIPTIYLTVPAAINQDINDVLKKVNGEALYYQATIQVVDNSKSLEEFTDSKLEIKVRGNSTANGTKRPYRLKFGKDDKDPETGEVITSHKHDLLGAGYKKRNWVLMANAFDGSMVRNALSYRVGQLVGMDFCPGWKFVDLVINEEYRGTYMLSDHIEVGKNRINVNEDTGWYIEANGQSVMAEEPYTSGGGLTLSIKNPEPATEAETATLKSAVSTFFTDLSAKFSASNSADPTTGWRSMADEESLLALWLGVNITANWDGFMTVKMYRDINDPRIHFGPLWDHDLSLGNHEAEKLLNHRVEEYDNGNFNQIMRKAWADPLFIKKLHAKWNQLIQAGLKKDLIDYVDMLHRTIEKSEALNHQKWTTYQAGFVDSKLNTHDETIEFLEDYIDKHIDNIQDLIDAQYEALKNQMPEDGPEDEQGGEEGGSTEYVPFESGAGDWGVVDLPASAFPQNAVSAKITVTDARYVLLFKDNDQSKNVYSTEYNDANMTGVNFILTGENLDLAKAGRLSIKAGSNEKSFRLTVTCEFSSGSNTETPETPDTPDTPSETFTQLTDLPTMYLQIYKLNADGTSDKTQTETITKSGGDYHTARIVIVDKNNTIKERDEETQIRGRGNSTWSGDNLKNPYRLKFPAKTKLLSYLAEDGTTVVNNYANAKSWTLLSNKGDYSLIRNALTAELGKYMDMPFVPAYKFVDLVINGSYAGTYQISDQIQVAKDRVNVNSDTGWLLSANRGGGYEEDPYFTTGGATFNIKNPEADTPTASGETTDTKYDAMKTWMEDALATPYINGANRLSEETLAAKFDMESLANYIIGIDITGDPDGAIDNFYMYKEADESSKMKFGPMWDYDLAYGNVTSRDHKESHFFADETYGWGYKVKQMYNTPTVITAIWKRWKKVYGEYDSAAKQSTLTKYLLAKVDELEAIIAQSQAKNFEAGKAGSVAGSNTYSTHAAAISALKAWIPEHIEWLNTAYRTDYKTITGHEPDDLIDDPETPTPERAQLTNLPTIYLDAEVGSDRTGASLEVIDSENKLGQGTKWTKTTADVSVQYQGSGNKNKDSYRLKFEAKTQLLSSGKFKQWVLLANDDDPTMMRNALAKEMGDALGLPFTPGYQFVDLYVNDEYMGTYQVTDRIKVESGRAFVTGGNKDDDWHIRFNDAGEYNEDKPTYYIEGTTTAPYIIPKNPDPKDNPTTWNSTLKSAMTTYFNSVFTTDASGKYTAFAENVDHQQFIQWYIAQEMLGVYKGFSSIEAYRSVTATDKSLHIGVLWDSEKAFGNTGEAPAINMADIDDNTKFAGLMTNYAAYDVMKNIFTQLWQERWFANGVNNLWKEKHEAMLSAMTTKAAALKTELEGSWAQNATKWSITGEQATSIDAMTAWLTQRDAYLTKKFAALAAALPCENHTYENNNYIKQDNGTYLVGCDVCGTIKEDSETFYKFTVYPESATKTEVIATSWQPSAEHPNSYATVTITPSGAESSISGYNIINTTKNAGGDKTCADFRLTDGHPYYGDDGFVATKATYIRNISNEWGTLCLPFKTQKATTEYADFYHLGSVKNDNKNNASTLVFTPVQPEIDGNASAFIPVVFRATAKAKQEGKIVIEATNVSVKKTTGKSFITTNSTVADWTLIGTVEKKYFADIKSELASNEQLYYIAQNKFWQATTTYTNNPFRAYFIYAPSTPSAAKVSMFSISTDDNLATDITSVNATRPLAIFTNTGSVSIVAPKDMKVSIYSANGMLVETIDALKDTEYNVNLAAGIYMVNGLKFVVK